MTWTIEYAASIHKKLRKADPQTRRRIRNFLEERLLQQDDPRQLGRPLTGRFATLWRYRVGDHHILCEIQDHRLCVLVVRIAHRRDAYQGTIES